MATVLTHLGAGVDTVVAELLPTVSEPRTFSLYHQGQLNEAALSACIDVCRFSYLTEQDPFKQFAAAMELRHHADRFLYLYRTDINPRVREELLFLYEESLYMQHGIMRALGTRLQEQTTRLERGPYEYYL